MIERLLVVLLADGNVLLEGLFDPGAIGCAIDALVRGLKAGHSLAHG
jgi:hypothetical protein